MKKPFFVILAVVAAVFISAAVLADEKTSEPKVDTKQACNPPDACVAEAAQTDQPMIDECHKMLAEAQQLMDKGKTIRGQGLIWGDKKMEAEGLALYEQGKKMWDDAKSLNEDCAKVIADMEKMKKKHAAKNGGSESSGKSKSGDSGTKM